MTGAPREFDGGIEKDAVSGRARAFVFSVFIAFVIKITLLLTPLAAQTSSDEKRVALVVGSNEYDHVLNLANPANDAAAISAVLREMGFEVVESIDVSYDAMVAATRAFGRAAEGADVTLFFYAGHAIQYKGQNYLVPTDARLDRPTDIDSWLINIDFILRQLQAPTNIIVLDACRDNPFEDLQGATRNISGGSGGLAPLHASRGTFIAYATEPNRVAYDGFEDDHSPFTRALLTHMETPGLEIGSLMKRVRADVYRATESRQVPWEESSLFNDFYFIPEDQAPVALAERRQEPETTVGGLIPRGPNHPPQAAPVLNALEVSNKAVQAPLAMVPPIRDPDGDQLWVQILELPEVGAVRVSRKQVKIGDRMPLDALMAGVYFPGLSPPIGPAGKIRFQVYDQQDVVTSELPIEIIKENEPPVFDVQESVVATLGRGPQRLSIKPPLDPDGDSVFVTIAGLPAAGDLVMRGVSLDEGISVTTEQITELRYLPPDGFIDDPGEIKLEAHDGSHSVTKTIRIELNRNPMMATRTARFEKRRARVGAAAIALNLERPSDPDGDRLRIRVAGLPNVGNIRIGSDGPVITRADVLTADDMQRLIFEPTSEGRGYLMLEIGDGRGGFNQGRVELIVDPANRGPRLLRPETRLVAMAGETIPLRLERPIDPDGDSIAIQIVSLPKNGEVLIAGEPLRLGDVLAIDDLAGLQFRAARSAGSAPAQFRFVVTDAYGAEAKGLVEIAINHPPTGEKVTKTILAGGSAFEVVPNVPTDVDGDALAIRVQSVPFVGRIVIGERLIARGDRLTVDDLGKARYELPTHDFYGPAGTFDYLIDDGRGGTATGTTTIIINSPPVVQANPGFEFDLANGRSQFLDIPPPVDRERDELRIEIIALPTQGQLKAGDRILAVGDELSVEELRNVQIAIDPSAMEAGTAGAFVYEVRDVQDAATRGSIDIAIRAPNHPPTAPRFDRTVQIARGPVTLFDDRAMLPTDPDDDALAIEVVDLPWSGQVELNGQPLASGRRIGADDLAALRYRPGEDAGPAGAFVYTAKDGRGQSAEGAVTLTLNRPPMIAGRVGFGGEESLPAGDARTRLFKPFQAAEDGLLPPPTDDPGDSLEIEIVRLPERQGLTLWLDDLPVGQGKVVRGAESFGRMEIQATEELIGERIDLEFAIRDTAGAASTVTLAVTVVAGPNVPPIFLGQGLRTVVEKDGPQDLDLLPPTDTDPLKVFLTDVPKTGSLMLAGETIRRGHVLTTDEVGQLQYDPGKAEPGMVGSIKLTAVDDKGASGEGQFILRIDERPNRAPVLPDQPAVELVIGVGQLPLMLQPPDDPDGDPLTIQVTAIPQNGELRFGDRPAEVGMLLTSEELKSAYFTPYEDKPLVRGGESSLDYSVNDGRGGLVQGRVRISTHLHDCDRLASSSDNFDSVSKDGVIFAELDSSSAIPACRQALQDYGEIVRFRFQLARAQHAGSDFEDAWQNYSLAAQSGDVAAQYNLAMLLLEPDRPSLESESGSGADNLVPALEWLRLASESSWTKAQTSFAAIVINRRAELPEEMTDRYDQEARRWLEVAAEQNDPTAMTILGNAYAEGQLGSDVDLEKARRLLEGAAGLDSVKAQTSLGVLYASGRFGDGSVGNAAPWFEAAADEGDLDATVSLGALHAKGHGVPKDPKRAISLYALACASDARYVDLVETSIRQMERNEISLGIQTLLAALGYNPGYPDGIYGSRTERAVQGFAKDRGLDVSGMDRPTLLLNIMDCG